MSVGTVPEALAVAVALILAAALCSGGGSSATTSAAPSPQVAAPAAHPQQGAKKPQAGAPSAKPQKAAAEHGETDAHHQGKSQVVTKKPDAAPKHQGAERQPAKESESSGTLKAPPRSRSAARPA